jgi:hypothetical protein
MFSIQKKFRYHYISFTRPDRERGHIECLPERQGLAGEVYRDVIWAFNQLIFIL